MFLEMMFASMIGTMAALGLVFYLAYVLVITKSDSIEERVDEKVEEKAGEMMGGLFQ